MARASLTAHDSGMREYALMPTTRARRLGRRCSARPRQTACSTTAAAVRRARRRTQIIRFAATWIVVAARRRWREKSRAMRERRAAACSLTGKRTTKKGAAAQRRCVCGTNDPFSVGVATGVEGNSGITISDSPAVMRAISWVSGGVDWAEDRDAR